MRSIVLTLIGLCLFVTQHLQAFQIPPGAPVCSFREGPSSPIQSFQKRTNHRPKLRSRKSQNAIKLLPRASQDAIKIDVHFIAIVEQDADRVNESTIDQQMQVINDAYNEHNIFFTLANFTNTVDPRITDLDRYEVNYGAIRAGDWSTLNVLWVPNFEQTTGTAGLCPFVYPVEDLPKLNQRDDDELPFDTCIIDIALLPGGHRWNQTEGGYVPNPDPNKKGNIFTQVPKKAYGKIAVHEIGHWMGLLHPWGTLDGLDRGQSVFSCDGPGDYVDDTPEQSRKWANCPDPWTNSCKWKHKGPDDIKNFMGYADDNCMDHFTPGQVTRMHQVFQQFRKNRGKQGGSGTDVA